MNPTSRRRVLGPVPAVLVALGCSLAYVPAAYADGPGIFSRVEPRLQAGAEALQQGEHDSAVDLYRGAAAQDRRQRAVIRYDVGNALLKKAEGLAETEAPAGGISGAPGSGQGPAIGEETAAVLDEAIDNLQSAYELSDSGGLRSDAALARGNALAAKGDVEGALDAFRTSVVENPNNGAARWNLRQALRVLRSQPPQQGGESKEGDEGEDKEGEEQEESESGEGEQDPGEEQGEQGESGDDEQKGDGEEEREQGQGEGDPKDDSDKEQGDKDKGQP